MQRPHQQLEQHLVKFVDQFAIDVYYCIGVFAPERGGLLFTHKDHENTLALCIPDTLAATTQVSYLPSEAANRIIQETEAIFNVRFHGVIHSHPANMPYPSGPDEKAMDSLLNVNPSLKYVITPIVTHRRTAAEPKTHEFHYQQMNISFFLKAKGEERSQKVAAVCQRSSKQVALNPTSGRTFLEYINQVFCSNSEIIGKDKPGGYQITITHKYGANQILSIRIFYTNAFPFFAPSVYLNHGDNWRCIDVPWDFPDRITTLHEGLFRVVHQHIADEAPDATFLQPPAQSASKTVKKSTKKRKRNFKASIHEDAEEPKNKNKD